MNNFWSLTDALENKRTKKISEAAGNYQDFTDYTLDNAVDTNGVLSWSRDGAAPANLTLTNLVLNDAARVGDIDATGFNLLIKGKKAGAKGVQIDLLGTVKAKSISVLAEETHENRVIDPNSDSLLDKAGDVIDWVAHSFDQNVVKQAVINVEGTAKLFAVNDIDLTALVKQAGGLLQNDLIGMIADPVNVKIGTAQVNIASGALLAAGYGADGAESPSGSGSINVRAKLNADMTSGQGKVAMPIAVNVAVQNAAVNVEKGAVLKAAGNIAVDAGSAIQAAASAGNKIASKELPFAAAVGVILNNATVDVKGALTAGKGVFATARGDLTTDAAAKHESGLSGVFLGTTVALQNVRAQIAEGAAVNAGGPVKVKSTANIKATTVARSGAESGGGASKQAEGTEFAEEKEDSGWDKTTDMGLGMAKELGGGIWGKLKEKVIDKVVGLFKRDPSPYEKMDKLMQSVAGGNYTVKLAEDSEQKGDVKFTTTTRGGKAYTDVTITPWEGHRVDKVYYVYLNNESGQDAATKYTVTQLEEDEDDLYTIPQRNANVLVYVTYKDGESRADDPDTWTPDDLFNENDDDYGQDLQSLFDDAAGGARDSDAEEPADADDDEGADRLKFSVEPSETKDGDDHTVGAILNTNFDKATGV